MSTLTIELPETLLLGTGQPRDEFVKEATFLLMAKLFELGRVSSGKAAPVCGMGRIEFLHAVGRMGVPVVQLDDDELDRELADA